MTTSQLRVLHVTASDSGGAGIACIRLHRALRDRGVDSRVLVQRRSSTEEGVTQAAGRWSAALRFRLDRIPLHLYRRRQIFAWWSVNWLPRAAAFTVGEWQPHIIHTHWIGNGFVSLESLASVGRPIVWTMHDMWPFTGGCHYSRDCSHYEKGCGHCPQLHSGRLNDLSLRSAARKARAWTQMKAIAVSPSKWLADAARQSSILQHTRVEVVPNGLDGTLFRPGDALDARRQLGLPLSDRIILSGAVDAVKDERKGFHLLSEAIRRCVSEGQVANWRLLVFGANSGPGQETMGIPVSYCGIVNNEEELPRIYQSADVYAIPSLQDNLPNTAVEAMACGIPVLAFRAGGLADMIRDGINGRLATPFDVGSLASALRDILNRPQRSWSQACREEFERTYAWPGPADRYLDIYREML